MIETSAHIEFAIFFYMFCAILRCSFSGVCDANILVRLQAHTFLLAIGRQLCGTGDEYTRTLHHTHLIARGQEGLFYHGGTNSQGNINAL